MGNTFKSYKSSKVSIGNISTVVFLLQWRRAASPIAHAQRTERDTAGGPPTKHSHRRSRRRTIGCIHQFSNVRTRGQSLSMTDFASRKPPDKERMYVAVSIYPKVGAHPRCTPKMSYFHGMKRCIEAHTLEWRILYCSPFLPDRSEGEGRVTGP